MRGLITLMACLLSCLSLTAQYDIAHDGEIKSVAITPDNRYVLSGAEDKTLKVWEISTGNQKFTFRHPYPVKEIYVSPDSRWVITSDLDQNYCLWNLSTGKMEKCIADEHVLGFTPDSKGFFVATYENDFYGKRTGQAGIVTLKQFTRTIFDPKIPVDSVFTDVKLSADGQMILIANGSKDLYTLRGKNRSQIKKMSLPEPVEKFAIDPDLKRIVVNNSQTIYDFKTGKSLCTLERKIDSNAWFDFFNDQHLSFTDEHSLVYFRSDSCIFVRKESIVKTNISALSRDHMYQAFAKENKLHVKPLYDAPEKTFESKELTEKIAFTHYVKGLYYFRNEKYKEAIHNLSIALKRGQNLHNGYFYRGEAYRNTGKYELAIQDYLKDDEENPFRSYFQIAQCYASLNQPENVISYLTRLQQSAAKRRWDEIFKEPLFSRFHKSSLWKEFAAVYSVKFEAENLIVSGEERLKRNDKMAALEFFNKAISKDPYTAEWYRIRGDYYYNSGEYAKAIEDFKRELKFDSSRITAVYLKVARALYHKREYNRCFNVLNELIRIDKSQFHLLVDLGYHEIERYNRTLAMEYLNRYLEYVPEDYYARYLRASIRHDSAACKADIIHAIELCKEQGAKVPDEFYELHNVLMGKNPK
ncbi:MAG: WD40 repeat domain-containing protein [Cytophagaceae bacterium]